MLREAGIIAWALSGWLLMGWRMRKPRTLVNVLLVFLCAAITVSAVCAAYLTRNPW